MEDVRTETGVMGEKNSIERRLVNEKQQLFAHSGDRRSCFFSLVASYTSSGGLRDGQSECKQTNR